MEAGRATRSLAEASMTLTQPHDVIGALDTLLAACSSAMEVRAGAVLVAVGDRLELLAASSHEAAELELHQLTADDGPCLDAYRDGIVIDVAGIDDVRRRWPRFADAMAASSYTAVHASPLTLNGRRIGAMGLFRTSTDPFTADEDAVARAFAAIAASLTVQTAELPSDVVEQRLRDALDGRVLLEQAKGVLADARDLSIAEAYVELVRSARERGVTLRDRAQQVVDDALAR
jgi:transcriptional regulator with GAF, ATPase, and Fis domain